MPMYPFDLSRPRYGTVTYIRTETPGLIAECRDGFISSKILPNVFNYFTNYFKTWSQVCGNGFLCFAVPSILFFMVK